MADESRVHPRAGRPAQAEDLVDVPRLVAAYYTEHPDVGQPAQRVAFGTSGHRGSSLRQSFNEDHVVAISQAICRVSTRGQGIDGPLFLARDTHALSEPAMISALEVFAANGVRVLHRQSRRLHPDAGRCRTRSSPTTGNARPGSPTAWSSRRRTTRRPTGDSSTTRPTAARPASDITAGIEDRANELLGDGTQGRARGCRRPGPHRRHDRQLRLPRRATSATSARVIDMRRDPGGRACGSAPIRWVAPASRTGPRSPTATAST